MNHTTQLTNAADLTAGLPVDLSAGLAAAPAIQAAGGGRAAAGTDPAAPRLGASLILILATIAALLLLIQLGMRNMTVPAPQPLSAAPAAFSAARAMDKLQHIAAEPHATGTAANAEVRRYLLQELEALGLQPQVQSALGTMVSPGASIAGYIHNIAVRIPGEGADAGVGKGKALMLSAHYDSVPTGAGAADDGASVAAILETVRALRSGGPLRNDLIVLFTDGEEAGLLGAEAFASQHPWFRDVGLVLNFEYRGNSGPMLMFETSNGNGNMISAFADAPRATGSSLMYEVYRMLPNDTDMSAFKRAGLMGMNFAAMERPTSYHTQLDRPELLNQGTLQHQGEIMLALTRHFGNADLAGLKSANRVYFDVPGLGMVHYPAGLALPLAAVVALLAGAALVLGVRSGALRTGRVIAAALLLPLLALLMAVGFTMLWGGLGVLHPVYRALLDPYNGSIYMGAFVLLTIGLFALVQYRLQRWFVAMELTMGAVLFWLMLLLATAAVMPGASYVFTWPLLPLLPALGWLMSARGRTIGADARLLLLLVASAPAVYLFAPLVRTLFVAMTMQMSGVAVFMLVLLLGILYPLAVAIKRRLVFPALALSGGALLLGAGSMTAGVSAEQPRPDTLFYALDGASGKALWLSNDPVLDAWLQPVFGPHPVMRKVPELFGDRPRQYWVAPAASLDIAAPLLEVTADSTAGAVRTIGLHIASRRAAPQMKLYGEGVEVLHAELDGRVVTREAQKEWALAAGGIGPDGARLTLQVKAGQPFRLRLIDRSYGLPASVAPRGAESIIQPLGTSDSVQAVQSVAFP